MFTIGCWIKCQCGKLNKCYFANFNNNNNNEDKCMFCNHCDKYTKICGICKTKTLEWQQYVPFSDCFVCNGSGRSYWSDGIYGSCLQCIGVECGEYEKYCQDCLTIIENNENKNNYESIPRLNGKLLLSGKFKQLKVSIIGKYLKSSITNYEEFEASDGKNFFVKVNDEYFNGYTTSFIEICGFVNNDGTITQNSYQEFSNEFDIITWNKFIYLAQQFPNLF